MSALRLPYSAATSISVGVSAPFFLISDIFSAEKERKNLMYRPDSIHKNRSSKELLPYDKRRQCQFLQGWYSLDVSLGYVK